MRVAIEDSKPFIDEVEYDSELPTQVTENLSDVVGSLLQRISITQGTVESTSQADFEAAVIYIGSCRAWERNFLIKISQDATLPSVPISLIDAFPNNITNIDLLYLMNAHLWRICDLWQSTTLWGNTGIIRKALIGSETVEGVKKYFSLLYQMARVPLEICVSRDTVQATMEGTPPCIKQE